MHAVYRYMANTLAVLHAVLIAGLFMGWYFPAMRTWYLIMLVLWIGPWLFCGYCPITKWEFLLRKKYDAQVDPDTGFIQHYWRKFFGRTIPEGSIFVGGLILFVVFFVLGYRNQ